MPTVKDKTTGDVVSQQPYTPEGTQRAKQIADTDANWELNYAPNGQTDGAKRSETMYAGGGKTGYSNIGIQSDSTWYGAPKVKDVMQPVDEYEKGGKTKKNKKDGFVKKVVKGIEKVADKAWEGVDKVTRGGVMKIEKKLDKWTNKREKITKIKKTARKLKQKARREQTMGLTDFKTRRQKKKDINVRKKELIKEIKNK